MDEDFDHKHIEGGDRCGFGDGEIAAVDAAEHDDRQWNLPGSFPDGRQRLCLGKRGQLDAAARPEAPGYQNQQHQQPRQDAGQEHVVYRDGAADAELLRHYCV